MLGEAKPYLRRAELKLPADADLGRHPLDIAAVRALDGIDFHADVTFFVGENGSGKSTVLEALAVALGHGAEGGTRNVRLATTESVSGLGRMLRLVRSWRAPRDHYFLRAETFFNVATYMDEVRYLGGYGHRSLHARSHGEAFMAVLLHKLKGDGLYLFDEPEAALSPSRQLAALSAIHGLVRQGSQFIIATHSPILLAYPNARILKFDENGIAEVAYEQTEHYALTRDFLNHHAARVKRLLDDP
ncbi:AAA family ATPase [Stenotrophomonas sp. MMGLT7]|uniref:AAA family ATPase n=1 Tax=Stenotrophomonas sp. MMGLT7 TaxID=2901227 RepID=UPI001E433F31|nr:AAA family ATPase [Stenotrophomonas sp. MMGLT7]MCD7098422.1 AAA family ATPase [Stenotrophomonas sp. MMGLT7]